MSTIKLIAILRNQKNIDPIDDSVRQDLFERNPKRFTQYVLCLVDIGSLDKITFRNKTSENVSYNHAAAFRSPCCKAMTISFSCSSVKSILLPYNAQSGSNLTVFFTFYQKESLVPRSKDWIDLRLERPKLFQNALADHFRKKVFFDFSNTVFSRYRSSIFNCDPS